MLKSAKDILASGDIRAIVDYAIEANRVLKAATEDLASMKEYLRGQAQEARKTDDSVTSVRFEGQLGVAHVVIPSKSFVKVKKGMNPADLKKVVGADVYEHLFVEKTVIEPRAEYETAFADLSPRERLVVENYVGVFPALPRVNIPE